MKPLYRVERNISSDPEKAVFVPVADFFSDVEAFRYCREFASDYLNWKFDFRIVVAP